MKKKLLFYITINKVSILSSEMSYLKKIYDKFSSQYDIEVYDVYHKIKNLKFYKEKIGENLTWFNESSSYDKVFVMHPLFNDVFFGGIISNQQRNMWVDICKFSEKFPLLIRMYDYKCKLMNYNQAIQKRFCKKDKFYLLNEESIEEILQHKEINHSNIKYLLNGKGYKERWHEILGIKKENVIYANDDLFFDILSRESKFVYDKKHNSEAIFIGFLTMGNTNRVKLLNEFLTDVKLSVLTIKTKFLTDNGNLTPIKSIREHLIHDVLRKYKAGIFINKGDPNEELEYINKTIYDFFISKIPCLIYLPIDKDKSIYPNIDCYFSNNSELNNLLEKLNDDKFREEIFTSQYAVIKKSLSSVENSYDEIIK